MYGGYLLLCSIVLVVSCTSEFDDINTNKNALSKLETISASLPVFQSAIYRHQ